MKKNAFICPLYDIRNHFDLAFDFYKSYLEHDICADFWFVFSNEEQYRKFANRIRDGFSVEIKYMILPAEMLQHKSQAVLKKLYGLEQLMGKYEYLSAVDAECLFIDDIPESMLQEIWENQTCMNCNISYYSFTNLRSCFKTLNIEFNRKLLKEFKAYKYNFWFNEIPVYKSENLSGFFEWIRKHDPQEKWRDNWYCFEYYMYAAYLIMEHGMHLKKYYPEAAIGGIIEILPCFTHEKAIHLINEFGTHWSSDPNVVNKNTKMIFHLDKLDVYTEETIAPIRMKALRNRKCYLLMLLHDWLRSYKLCV